MTNTPPSSDFTLIITLFIVFAALFYLNYWLATRWKRSHPLTLEQYIAKNPHAKTNEGMACATCNSKRLYTTTPKGNSGRVKIVSCNSCATPLYHAKH